MTLDDIKRRIDDSENVVVLAHEMPDGDAIGSALAMCLLIRELGKNAVVLMKNIPSQFDFLPGMEYVYDSYDESQVFDLAIVLDCPNINRVSKEFIPFFEGARYKVQFDHHDKNSMFADYNIVNHISPAACQILVSSIEYMGYEISKDVATCLLTGIITDTNGFKSENVTIETFDFVSSTLEMGINLSSIYKDSLLRLSMGKFEVQKLAMNRMEFFADGKISFTYINMDDVRRLDLKPGDRDGIVEIGRNIEGVEVSIFLYELPNGYKVSLRSNDYVNVADICMLYGGGGHIKAAASPMHMEFEEAKKIILNEVEKRLK